MKIGISVNKTNAILIYILIAFFPGCMCAHFLRMVAVSNTFPQIAVGTMVLLLPFLTLALVLLILVKQKDKQKPNQFHQLYLYVGLLSLLLATVVFSAFFVDSTTQVYQVSTGEIELSGIRNGWETPYGIHFLSAWFISYSAGFGFLLSGIFFQIRDIRKNKRDTT